MQRRRPVMLVILDGWGWRDDPADNAIRQAKTPTFDRLWRDGPHGFLRTSGNDVGLPDGQMGNSEVGHLNIGAGRVVMQDLPRIGGAIANGDIKQRAGAGRSDRKAQRQRRHLSSHRPGFARRRAFASGSRRGAGKNSRRRRRADAACTRSPTAAIRRRNRPAKTSSACIAALPKSVAIATVCGRYYAMDRDKRWERVAKAYNAIVEADGPRFPDAPAVVADAYANKKFDEFIMPAVVGDYRGMKDGDGVLCFNFRADRVREILGAMLDPDFSGFPRQRVVRFAAAVGMTQYSEELDKFMQTIFPPQPLAHILGEVVAEAGRTQLRMAETEKYAHVTYFLNGGREEPYRGEDRIMVPSPKVATYDLQPEMSAPELTDKAVAAINSGKYDLIVLNYANPDMVGHTGSLPAAIKAVETVDAGLGRIAEAIEKSGGALLVTADHGNCEMMRDPQTGGPHTSHTTNPVPLLLLGARNRALVAEGRLADIAPTLLELMELPKPKEMTGHSLLRAD